MGAEPTALKTSLTLVGLVAAGVGAGSIFFLQFFRLRGPKARRVPNLLFGKTECLSSAGGTVVVFRHLISVSGI